MKVLILRSRSDKSARTLSNVRTSRQRMIDNLGNGDTNPVDMPWSHGVMAQTRERRARLTGPSTSCRTFDMACWYVYLLRCSDDSLYCGTTMDLQRRLQEHNDGTGCRYTRSRLPVRLVWYSGTLNKSEAYKEEYRIKRLSKTDKEMLARTRTDGRLY